MSALQGGTAQTKRYDLRGEEGTELELRWLTLSKAGEEHWERLSSTAEVSDETTDSPSIEEVLEDGITDNLLEQLGSVKQKRLTRARVRVPNVHWKIEEGVGRIHAMPRRPATGMSGRIGSRMKGGRGRGRRIFVAESLASVKRAQTMSDREE